MNGVRETSQVKVSIKSIDCNLQGREGVKEEKNFTILKEFREREDGSQSSKNFQTIDLSLSVL